MIPYHTRTIKYCESVCDDILRFVKRSYNIRIKSEPLDWISDVDSPWGRIFDGITILANEDFTEYEVGYEIWDNGSRWEPPSSDYKEDSKHKDIHSAVWRVVVLWMQDHFQNWRMESQMESLWLEDEGF